MKTARATKAIAMRSGEPFTLTSPHYFARLMGS